MASITLAVFARPDVGLIQKAREARLIVRLFADALFVRWLRFGSLLHIAWLLACRPRGSARRQLQAPDVRSA
jgi:hypothetical protein